MSELNALLITSIQDYLPITQYFPLNYNNNESITELLIIAKYFNNCGKGILRHKNKLFYYITYFPKLPDGKDNNTNNSNSNSNSGLSQSYSDYFIYSLDYNKKKFFLLFYCNSNCKQKIIEDLSNEIFDIFDKGVLEGHLLKKTARDEINNIVLEYQKIASNFENNNLLSNLYRDKNIIRKKRVDSRIIISKMKKLKTEDVSIDIDDLTSIKDSNTNFSLMFRYNINDEFSFIYKDKEYRKIKIWNIISCSILLLLAILILIIILKMN